MECQDADVVECSKAAKETEKLVKQMAKAEAKAAKVEERLRKAEAKAAKEEEKLLKQKVRDEAKAAKKAEKLTKQTFQQEAKPCAAGCGFYATWHPTHCCCACKDGGWHGGRCEKKPMSKTKTVEEEAGMVGAEADQFPEAEGVAGDKIIELEAVEEEAIVVEAVDSQFPEAEKVDGGKVVESEAPKEDDNLGGIAKTLEQSGLGSAEVLLELLKSHNGNVKSVLKVLLEDAE